MTGSRRFWKTAAWVVAAWLLAHLVLIASHVLLVFLYSVAVAPDLPSEEYQAFAQRSGPYVSILLGGPVFYLLGRALSRRVHPHGRRAALICWGLYSLTDLAVVAVVSETMSPLLAVQWVTSQAIKLAAVWLATRRA